MLGHFVVKGVTGYGNCLFQRLALKGDEHEHSVLREEEVFDQWEIYIHKI
jgi:hypothetical protein